jgi:alpha-tubulin suppressor-like RCC1 family protein
LTISCGAYHTTSIKTDGTLWSWGFNNTGQLGDGTNVAKSSPVQIGSLTTWYKLGNGFNFSMSLKTDGTFWSWGGNAQGQLGLSNLTVYSSPKQIGTVTTWSKLSSGGNANVLAILT